MRKSGKIILILILLILLLLAFFLFRYFKSHRNINIKPITGTATPTPSPDGTEILHPTHGWKDPVEKHYDKDKFIANARRKYLQRDVWDIESGDWDFIKEEKAIRKALEDDADNEEILYLLAYNQFDREKYDEAIEIFRKILDNNPDAERATEGLTYAYFKKEHYETSRKMAEKSLEKYPKNARLMHILAGSYLFGERNPGMAVEIYKKAVATDPDDERLWLGLGESYLEMKNKKESDKGIEILRRCIKRFPKYHIAYIVLAEEYYIKGEYQKAVDLLEKSIELDPVYYRAYSIIGDMLVTLGSYNKAEKYYRRTLKTNPRYEALIYVKMGKLYRLLGDDDKSGEYFREAVNVHKDNPEMNQEKAMGYLGLSRIASDGKQFNKAREYINKAFGDFPPYEYNNYYLALWYADKGDFKKAMGEMRKCLRESDTEESMEQYEIDYGIARIYAAEGKFDKAMEYLEKSVKNENNYRKVEILNRSGKDGYMAKLRDTGEYRKFEKKMNKVKQKLPQLQISDDLLY
ncbi:MAG: tetratricopeptide repeat protein [Candidatus Eremiobacteraeota bacterium]|nr:tetratricopeptide repeat protein [Candidatus Eremiobacteraeota bacterium]